MIKVVLLLKEAADVVKLTLFSGFFFLHQALKNVFMYLMNY